MSWNVLCYRFLFIFMWGPIVFVLVKRLYVSIQCSWESNGAETLQIIRCSISRRWLLIMISIFIIIRTNNIAKVYQQLILIQKGKKVSDMKADTLVQLLFPNDQTVLNDIQQNDGRLWWLTMRFQWWWWLYDDGDEVTKTSLCSLEADGCGNDETVHLCAPWHPPCDAQIWRRPCSRK